MRLAPDPDPQPGEPAAEVAEDTLDSIMPAAAPAQGELAPARVHRRVIVGYGELLGLEAVVPRQLAKGFPGPVHESTRFHEEEGPAINIEQGRVRLEALLPGPEETGFPCEEIDKPIPGVVPAPRILLARIAESSEDS